MFQVFLAWIFLPSGTVSLSHLYIHIEFATYYLDIFLSRSSRQLIRYQTTEVMLYNAVIKLPFLEIYSCFPLIIKNDNNVECATVLSMGFHVLFSKLKINIKFHMFISKSNKKYKYVFSITFNLVTIDYTHVLRYHSNDKILLSEIAKIE